MTANSGLQIAAMGAAGAVEVLHRRRLPETDDPALRRQLTGEYETKLINPYAAAERGYTDAAIMKCR